MKYSLCIEPVWEDIPFYDRISRAKDCGVDAIEFWDPSVYDTKKIGDIAANLGIPISNCCLSEAWTIRMSFPWAAVEKNLEKSIAFGKDMGCSTFIGLSGDLHGLRDSEKLLLLENLKRTAEVAERENVLIVIEALNSIYDHKGYYLDSAYIGFELMRAVNSPNVKLLYDVYHMQLMQGNHVNMINENIDFIGHFHSAGVPGRHELIDNEINYPFIIKAADAAGYKGYFGFEYWPTYDNDKSVKDTVEYLRKNT